MPRASGPGQQRLTGPCCPGCAGYVKERRRPPHEWFPQSGRGLNNLNNRNNRNNRDNAKALMSADVDPGAAGAVRFGLAQDLPGDRGDLALAEEEEAQEVGEGLPSVHSK